MLCFFGKYGNTQQHLTKAWSVSTGLVLNAKGGNVSVHYHLNSFDELRLNFYGIQQTYLLPTNGNRLSLKTSSLSLAFTKGYKFQNIKKMTCLFWTGLFLG